MREFSLWCDFIENSFLDGDFLTLLYDKDVNAATSNPAIFKNAILNSPAYKDKIKALKNLPKDKLYEALVVADIAKAADKLALNYHEKDDGFISVEINPHLSSDTQGSLAEALRLYSEIAKPNVMIKLPATQASYPVMTSLLKSGINVNATLIFSTLQAKACLKAMQEGLELFRKNPVSKRQPQGVISVFVSRFDRLLNKKLVAKDEIGILNATKIYNEIELANEPNIRTLFASTGVKDEHLKKDYYITSLLFKHSINTAPLDAIAAFKRQLNPSLITPKSSKLCDELITKSLSLEELEAVSNELLIEGLAQFCDAYDDILSSLS